MREIENIKRIEEDVSKEVEKEYEIIWKRMALSVDWRYTYRTIDDLTRRLSQLSFIDLYNKDLVYRQKSILVKGFRYPRREYTLFLDNQLQEDRLLCQRARQWV